MHRPTSITIRHRALLGVASLFLVAACGGQSTAPSTDAPAPSITQAVATPDTTPAGATRVNLVVRTGTDVTVTIEDASGLLVDATSGTPGDGASVEPFRVQVTNETASTLRLTWSGGPCDLADRLAIDGTGRALRLVEPECPGDAIAFDRVLLLHLSGPVPAGEVHAVLQDGLDTDG
jgi:hypothetical protein